MIDSDKEQVYKRRARKTKSREGLFVTISLGGIVVQFTFISYLDWSYYTIKEKETFGKEKLLISLVAES